jgi:hypothetical protein
MAFRSVVILLGLLTLAACSRPEPAPPRVAAWQGEQTGKLFMRVLAEAPLRDARLLDPDGRQILTHGVSHPAGGTAGSDGPGWSRPSVGIGGSAGSSGGFGTGIGLTFPLGGGGSARPAGQASQIDFTLTPEQLAQYRARPAAWQLELRFDSGVTAMPAPALP